MTPQDEFWPAVNYAVVDRANVDDEPWVTITVNKDIAKWVRKQKRWYQHTGTQLEMFDIPESLYTLLRLRWPINEI